MNGRAQVGVGLAGDLACGYWQSVSRQSIYIERMIMKVKTNVKAAGRIGDI
jgi:hypothetical protein